MITAYFKFERLAEEVRLAHKIRSAVRLDCTKFAEIGQPYKGLDKFKNAKGHLCVYPSPCREVVKSNPKRRADICLTNVGNISSIFQDFSDLELRRFGWGDFGGDALLFVMNDEFSQIEVFVLPNLRNIAESLFDKFLDGDFDQEIEKMRAIAKPYFNYLSNV
jgi:hypothetical protein